MTRVATSMLVLAALVASVSLGSANAQPANPVIDRTFRCLTELQAGDRTLTVRAQAGVREYQSRTRWKSLAQTALHNGNLYDSEFLGVGAGTPQPSEGSFGAWINLTRCRGAAPRFPFSPRGLQGGAAGQLGDDYDCPATRVLHVRLRIELAVPGRLVRSRFNNLVSEAPARSATVAARTETGRWIALTTVSETGKARILVAKGCVAA